jgi:hypothetical protein
MNSYATPHRTMSRPARPRHIADLLVVPDGSPAADRATDTSTHSSSHWTMVACDPHAVKRAPAHVKALARDIGVDTHAAWNVLDGMYE